MLNISKISGCKIIKKIDISICFNVFFLNFEQNKKHHEFYTDKKRNYHKCK